MSVRYLYDTAIYLGILGEISSNISITSVNSQELRTYERLPPVDCISCIHDGTEACIIGDKTGISIFSSKENRLGCPRCLFRITDIVNKIFRVEYGRGRNILP